MAQEFTQTLLGLRFSEAAGVVVTALAVVEEQVVVVRVVTLNRHLQQDNQEQH